MPYTTSGIFERIHNWEEDRINGIEIVTDHHDAEDDNFANGLSQALVKDGRAPMEGNLKMGGFKIVGCDRGVNPNDVVIKSQLEEIETNFVPVQGDSDIYDTKVFLSSPQVPTPQSGDSSKQVANTTFVQSEIEQAFIKKQLDYLSFAFPTYQTLIAIQSGYTAPKAGFVIFELPPRMVGSIQIGAFKKSFSYSYNNTQPTLAVFPVAKGVVISFSGCNASFTSNF